MGPGPRWRQLLPDLLLWGLLFSSFTCPWVCTAAGGATSEAQKGRLRKAAAGAEAGDGNAARGPTAGPALRERALFRPGAGLFYKDRPPQDTGSPARTGGAPGGTSRAVPLALLVPGGVGRPLSCIPTVPLPGDGFLAFRLSREPVWTACSTMGLLPTGADGKPAPESGRG